LAATVKTTEPLPVPLAPDLIVMKDAVVLAVQVHVAALVPTLIVSSPPPPFALTLVGATANAHGGAVVVVVVVVDEGVVDELLEHDAATIAARPAMAAAVAVRIIFAWAR